MAAGPRPIKARRGQTYSHTVRFQPALDQAPSLPAGPWSVGVFERFATEPALVATVTLDEPEGQLVWSLSAEQTAQLELTRAYLYRVTNLAGQPTVMLEGPVQVE